MIRRFELDGTVLEPMGTDLNMDGDCLDEGEMESGDCDESDPAINPGAMEICGDGIDNDCDGVVDDGCMGGITGGACAAAGEGTAGLIVAFFLVPLFRRRRR